MTLTRLAGYGLLSLWYVDVSGLLPSLCVCVVCVSWAPQGLELTPTLLTLLPSIPF